MAATPAGGALEGRAIGRSLWARLHAATGSGRLRTAANAACGELPVPECLAAGECTAWQDAGDGLDLWGRFRKRRLVAGNLCGNRVRQARHSICELQLSAGSVRVFCASGPNE